MYGNLLYKVLNILFAVGPAIYMYLSDDSVPAVILDCMGGNFTNS